ncbi:NADPH-dependent FMN reductase [Streptomyces sp. TP-A0874]|uniref:NADPH-dependent FMN reductase n=1 Tax=Streptomyces sp. TP-A0874 TaxID=549819 RepID=UPI0008534C49|nr:NAD(P)H-dependent oxidoreductase [Streptomyces sp. TP-A0874]
MPKKPIRLAVIVGSTRQGRLGPTVAKWFIERARVHGGLDTDVIDLAEAGLPSELGGPPKEGKYASAEVNAYARRIAEAEAFVVVTPEYNRGYPAALKLAIDSVYAEWHAKPVGFVSHGGQSGGLRAVEQLRQVFAELHTVTVRDSVSFPMAWEQFDEDGNPHDAEGAGVAAKQLLDELVWWAEALRQARADRPYAF